MEKNYKCTKHLTNEGFFNEDGQWVCWLCYHEDIFNNPRGVILLEFEKGKYYLRLVDRSNTVESLVVELFKNKKLVKKETLRDLSTSSRSFESYKKNIIKGNIHLNREDLETYSIALASNIGSLERRETPESNLTPFAQATPVMRGNEAIYTGIDIREIVIDSTVNHQIIIKDSLILDCRVRSCILDRCIIGASHLNDCSLYSCKYFPNVLFRDTDTYSCLELRQELETQIRNREISIFDLI